MSEIQNETLKSRFWTSDQDTLVLSTGKKNKKLLKGLTNLFPNRTLSQLLYRYKKLAKIDSHKNWTRNEDILLISLVENHGKNWKDISTYFDSRLPEEIEDRYSLKLDPDLKRSKFDKEEDMEIIRLYELHGNKWNEIAKHFKNRNATMIRNRYYSKLKKCHKTTNKKGYLSSGSATGGQSIPSSQSWKSDSVTLTNFNVEKINSERHNENNENLNKTSTNENLIFSNTYVDNYEINQIPNDVFKLEAISSKSEEECDNNFNDQYKLAFKSKKNSFSSDEKNINNPDANKPGDNLALMKQFEMLEEVFRKVKEVSLRDSLYDFSCLKNPEMITLNKKLDEKRENLTHKLKMLKVEHLNHSSELNIKINSEIIRNSLIKQIEILVKLIKTTKSKIKLMSHTEENKYF